MIEIPRTLNWVAKRAECSVRSMFDKLKDEVKEDVATMNQLLPQANEKRFSFGPSTLSKFSVQRVDDVMGIIISSIEFIVEGDAIVVRESDNSGTTELFSATVTLNSEGRCLCKVGNDELEQWQVRKRALEAFFFRRPNYKSTPF